jgi:putative PIN family toxin of toxin-antitoxin system
MIRNKFRVVLDTNIIIASHLSESKDSPNKEIIHRWENDQFDVLWTDDTLHEYINKSKYFNVPEESIVKIISQFISFGEEVKIKFYHYEFYPEDAKDICFVLCALNGDGTHIITYDSHLLDLKKDYQTKFGIQVVNPITCLKQLRNNIS